MPLPVTLTQRIVSEAKAFVVGGSRARAIEERKAQGVTARIFHDIRQTLRVTGINLNFRTWARHEEVFPAVWEAMRLNAESRLFEDAADRLRSEAVTLAACCRRGPSSSPDGLGASQAYQVQAELDLYHYINPKLLVFTSGVRLAFDGGIAGAGDSMTEVGKLSLIRNAAALNTNLTMELVPFLADIEVPTLLLWGEDDEFQRIEYGERLAVDIPVAQLRPVRGAAHFVMFDGKDEVVRALAEFLHADVAPVAEAAAAAVP